uniref:BTB domain-containing protein n=1 Tax=Timema genevievae TaxID=629358 RepID=A0A7R9K8R8_TIMGE|nr:unnamed protein product [Timema genevievae]
MTSALANYAIEAEGVYPNLKGITNTGNSRASYGYMTSALTIKLHRIVLCMSSPRFAILFSTVKEDPVQITDVEPRIFNILLDYMYLDHVELKNAEDARHLYKASVSYAIPHLCEISAGYMAKDLNFDNIWPVLELVAEIQEPFLKEECGKVS